MHLKKILIAIGFTSIATGFALTAPVQAQTESERKEGFYLSATAGADFLNDSDFVGVQDPDIGVPGVTGAPANVNVGYETGFAIRGAVGYKLKKGLISFLKPRFELEVGYSESNVSGGSFNGGNQNFGGDLSKLTVTAAAYNDVIWSENQKVIPYFGSGIGIGVVDANITYFPNNGVATAPTFGVQGNRTGLVTFNAIGATVKASDKFDIFAEGRYTNVRRRNFDRRFIADGADGFNARLRDDTESFGVGIGVRAKF